MKLFKPPWAMPSPASQAQASQRRRHDRLIRSLAAHQPVQLAVDSANAPVVVVPEATRQVNETDVIQKGEST